MNDLMDNIEQIHTTVLGADRIRRNLNLKCDDVIEFCKDAIKAADCIMRSGKNHYVYKNGIVITVNAYSFTMITAHKLKPKIRIMTVRDYPCLEEFLYQAIFIPKGEAIPPRKLIFEPSIHIYIKDFGKQAGDLGIVAEQNGQIIGVAWTRIIPAYGHIDNKTPELAISLLPEFRGFGIGTKLMKQLFLLLKENGYTQTLLSVQTNNPAVNFYKRLGYKIVVQRPDGAGHEDYLMVKEL